jgi:molecular chaperone GrpE
MPENENRPSSPTDPAGAGAEEKALFQPDAAVHEAEQIQQQLLAELEQVKDHALRSQAELENYRKRMAREMEEERRYADLRLIRDLLPVLDNVELAISAAEKSGDAASLLQGFKLVAHQLHTLLQQHHCVKIEALHTPFDPSRHEALSQAPSTEHPPKTVIHVVRNGFQLYQRIVRPSQVIVAAAASQGN